MKTKTATTQKDKITITKRNDYTVLLTNQSRNYSGIYNTLIEISKDFNPADFLNGKLKKDFNYRLLRNESDPLANWQGRKQAESYTSETAIKKGINQINKQLRELKKEIAEARLNPTYLKLKPYADAKIKNYYTDFNFHDCIRLYREKPINFIWLIRETGSFLITAKDAYCNEIISGETRTRNKNFNHDYFYFSNNELKRINSVPELTTIYANMEQYQPEKTI